jgi:hypothetical protein
MGKLWDVIGHDGELKFPLRMGVQKSGEPVPQTEGSTKSILGIRDTILMGNIHKEIGQLCPYFWKNSGLPKAW